MDPSNDRFSSAVISVRDVSIGYAGKCILQDLTFDIPKGRITALLGGSGCGKSTLLKTMIGLLPVLKGDILIAGKSIVHTQEEERAGILRRFGTAFQNGALFRSYTLAENVALPMEEFTDLPPETIREKVREKLSLVGLDGFEDYMPGDLSGGMVKRAAVARALALDPEILFLDEPSAGLDPLNSLRLDDLILNIRDTLQTTIVLVTHELDSIFHIADEVLFLDSETKTLLVRGAPEDLRKNAPQEKVRTFLNRGKKE